MSADVKSSSSKSADGDQDLAGSTTAAKKGPAKSGGASKFRTGKHVTTQDLLRLFSSTRIKELAHEHNIPKLTVSGLNYWRNFLLWKVKEQAKGSVDVARQRNHAAIQYDDWAEMAKTYFPNETKGLLNVNGRYKPPTDKKKRHKSHKSHRSSSRKERSKEDS